MEKKWLLAYKSFIISLKLWPPCDSTHGYCCSLQHKQLLYEAHLAHQSQSELNNTLCMLCEDKSSSFKHSPAIMTCNTAIAL